MSKARPWSAACISSDHSYQLQPTNPSDDYGYVQLTRDEGQGLVCVKNLTDRSAHLLCREAGYVAGMTFSRPLTPASRGPVWAAELNCSREAVDINGCMGGEWTLLQQASDWCQPARVFCFPSEGKVVGRCSDLPLKVRWSAGVLLSIGR